jgi:integrase
MANRKVTLMLRIRTADGKRPFVPPVYAANGRLRPLYALVAGKVEHHPEGVYHLRYAKGDQRIWEPVGKDPNAAIAAKLRREHVFKAKEMGLVVAEESNGSDSRLELASAIADYITETKATRSSKTASGRAYELGLFQQCCTKMYLDQIDRRDLMDFVAAQREQGYSDRTIYNRFESVVIFLKAQGIRGLVSKQDWPKYVEEDPEIYSAEQLTRLFAYCDFAEGVLYRFFLGSGAREQEVMYTTWRDLDLERGFFTVSAKPAHGFKPKNFKGRTIPLPDTLVSELREWKRINGSSMWVFPDDRGEPRGHMLRDLKTLALYAGLNCSHCKAKDGKSCKTDAMCGHWFLHKFRATFATMHLQNGVDIQTVRTWLGHSDMESTMRYLALARGTAVKAKVNATFAAFAPTISAGAPDQSPVTAAST